MKNGKVQPSDYQSGVSFDKAMNQAFSEIFQNLQEIEEDSKGQKEQVFHQRRSRKVSAPAAWVTPREHDETTTIFKQPKQEMQRKIATITPALSTVPSLQSLEEEEVDSDQVDIGFGYQEVIEDIEEDFKKQGEDVVDSPRRRRVSAPARTLAETDTETTTTFKQMRKDLVRKLSRQTLHPDLTLSTFPWLECFEEEQEENFEPVEFNLSFLDDLMKA